MLRLAKRIRRWFNETKGAGSDFQYRFTGQDSRMFLHNFMFIIDAVKQSTDSEKQTFTLHVFAYICLQLRQIVSIVCRVVNIRLQDIAQLKQYCLNLFRACCLFTNSISPTIWCIGHVIPAHAMDVFNKYQLGLNCVSMEGRESKHITIGRYSQNTNFSGRWGKFFPTNLYSWFGYGRRAFMKRKTFSTNRHTSPKGYPMRNLVSVDLKLVHSNRSVIIAHISTWIKLIKVLSWGNFLLTRSCCDLHKACVQALKCYKGNL